jgi:hypothetical protein
MGRTYIACQAAMMGSNEAKMVPRGSSRSLSEARSGGRRTSVLSRSTAATIEASVLALRTESMVLLKASARDPLPGV